MKKCPYCGSNIEDNAQFCFHCMKELKKKSVIMRRTVKDSFLKVRALRARELREV